MSHIAEVCKMELKKWNLPLNFDTCRKVWWYFFHTFNTVFNMVFNMPNINIFNTPWNFDIAFNMCYSFQHMLKFSTCFFFTVFRTYWNFQHAFFTVFRTCWKFENFNMLFYNFQYSFSICFQHALQISTCSEIFNTLSNMKIWNIYSQIVTEPIQKYL